MTAPQGPDAGGAATRSEATPTGRPPAAATPTTVLPGAAGRRPPVRPGAPRAVDAGTSPAAGRARKARLAVKRVDAWSVFVFTLIAAVFLGVAVVVAVAALYAVLDELGVQASVNELFSEVTGEQEALVTPGRVVGGVAVLAAANVVLLTLLSTLGALLYNLCASFTGGIELTLGERDG